MMGGKREGAGRKPGSKNKLTVKQVRLVEASGITPLDYLLTEMRDPLKDDATRRDCAKAAAPYVHARLSNVQHGSDADNPFVVETIKRIVVDVIN